jgi:hypothetical protein
MEEIEIEESKEVLVKQISPKETLSGISVEMRADAFMCLALALFGEWMISSDSKVLIFAQMFTMLEALDYPEEDLAKFTVALNNAYEKFHKPNSFMG